MIKQLWCAILCLSLTPSVHAMDLRHHTPEVAAHLATAGYRLYKPEARSYRLDLKTIEDLELMELVVSKILTLAPTALGRARLLYLLHHPSLDPVEIRMRQRAISALARAPELRAQLGQLFRQMAIKSSKFAVAGDQLDYSRVENSVEAFFALSILTVATVAPMAALGLYGGVGIGTAVTKVLSPHAVQENLQLLNQTMSHVETVVPALTQVEDPMLKEIVGILDYPNNAEFGKELTTIRRALFAGGMNHYTSLLQDLTWINRLTERWARKKVKDTFRPLAFYLSALSELEALWVAAELKAAHPQALQTPTILEGEGLVDLNNVHHPHMLLGQGLKPSIGNRVRLETSGEKTLTLTGNQSSGKTTLLRAIGINLILGQIGMDITVEEESSFTPLMVFTNFHSKDSTLTGSSTFRGQSERLAYILTELKTDVPVLILADEILDGTSPLQHQAAERALFEALHERPNTLMMFATQDPEIAERAKALPGVINAHLSQVGYHLQPGPSTTENAMDVMEEAGIPAAVVAKARRYLQEIKARHTSAKNCEKTF